MLRLHLLLLGLSLQHTSADWSFGGKAAFVECNYDEECDSGACVETSFYEETGQRWCEESSAAPSEAPTEEPTFEATEPPTVADKYDEVVLVTASPTSAAPTAPPSPAPTAPTAEPTVEETAPPTKEPTVHLEWGVLNDHKALNGGRWAPGGKHIVGERDQLGVQNAANYFMVFDQNEGETTLTETDDESDYEAEAEYARASAHYDYTDGSSTGHYSENGYIDGAGKEEGAFKREHIEE